MVNHVLQWVFWVATCHFQLSQTTFVVHCCGHRTKKLDTSGTLLTLHVGFNLHLFWCGIDRAGQREKPEYYTSSCSNFSSLPLKSCCHCCKLETELIMNKVNRSQILFSQVSPWSDFAQVLKYEGKSYIFTAGVGTICIPLLCENVVVPVVSALRFELLMRLCCWKFQSSRIIELPQLPNSKWSLCIFPLLKQSF